MSDQLLVILRVCLLALVYLVFLRVLRAVWVELKAEQPAPEPAVVGSGRARRSPPASPAPQPSPAGAPMTRHHSATSLVIVAPAGRAGSAFSIEGETTIGRGAGCGVVLDDPHVSKLHARVYPHDGSWLVEDLGSTNGTAVDGVPITGAAAVHPGSRLQIGDDIVMELR